MRTMPAAAGIVVLLCTVLAGCAELRRSFIGGNPFDSKVAGFNQYFPTPSVARVPVSASTPADEITYEYSRLSSNEFAFATAAAERDCRAGGKAAQVVSLVPKNQDRSWATFVCR